ncbi:hypothetical protein [Methylobacterium gnaphalii]|uniref:Uncharacterized protein n=1 Tax=Methylobacterium gnaphalii TaxID=1010610 RepID=A0A512JM44_9HYPH|nr:hypothetical protein [Methylobacterium gnaphalii]GEP11036.1 hypothetical protein MGN01_28810 [Methylobacterium gnaphalii]GJD69624.1 hypothetical protein MMMDOFMJ_2561 [Methylobacterium gnaphalii]GLS50314.1 hypothetical protein GCM10007885_31660 [Methylobacterium gnaphalii]
MAERTTPTETVTRKPDDDVGKPGSNAANGGRQTPQQAAITGIGGEGRSDASRSQDMGRGGSEAPAPVGGSSGGHSDQRSADGSGKVAAGHYKVEKERE